MDNAVFPILDSAQNLVGNAVYTGTGGFVTASHVIANHQDAKIELEGRAISVIATQIQQRDLGLIVVPNVPSYLASARVTRLDRKAKLTIRGWLPDPDDPKGRKWLELSGSVRKNVGSYFRELELEESFAGSIEGLSGSGVFDKQSRLVGILTQQRFDRPQQPDQAEQQEVRIVHFLPLDDWTTLTGERFTGAWIEDVPRCWQASWLTLYAHLSSMTRPKISVLDDVERTLQIAHNRKRNNGYIVIEVESDADRSALMAELIRKYGVTRCLWLSVTPKMTLTDAENVLLHQLDYLMERDFSASDTTLHADPANPGSALEQLLADWTVSETAPNLNPLIMFLDGLHHLHDPALTLLTHSLPDNVYVVAGLHPNAKRLHLELTAGRGCLTRILIDPRGKCLYGFAAMSEADLSATIQRAEAAVFPLRVPKPSAGFNHGNAVHLWRGRYLTSRQLFPKDVEANLWIPKQNDPLELSTLDRQVKEFDPPWSQPKLWRDRDLVIVVRQDDVNQAQPATVIISALDPQERVTVRGWFGFGNQRHRQAYRGQSRLPVQSQRDSSSRWEFKLDAPADSSLQHLIGSGVFNRVGQLVGVVTAEQSPGRILQFTSLEDWKVLTDGMLSHFWTEPILPECWRSGQLLLTALKTPYERDEILSALEETLKQAPAQHKNGFIVLFGGEKRGKSAIMAELIRRFGPMSCLWLFARRGQTRILSAEDTLIDQLAYLMCYDQEQRSRLERANYRNPGAALRRLLAVWVDSEHAKHNGRLFIFLDGLDELEGPGLQLLRETDNEKLPEGVFIVVSSRPLEAMVKELIERRPCLGVVDLDGEDRTVKTGEKPTPNLIDPAVVLRSNESAVHKVWDVWANDSANYSPNLVRIQEGQFQLPPNLLHAVINRFQWEKAPGKVVHIVGFHADFARIWQSRGLFPEEEIPGVPGDMDRYFWEFAERYCRDNGLDFAEYQRALGLIAVTMEPLHLEFLPLLLNWPSMHKVPDFLELFGRVLFNEGGQLTAQNSTWREFVQSQLKGDRLAECHQLLADEMKRIQDAKSSFRSQPMDNSLHQVLYDIAHRYWLLYGPSHLISVCRDKEARESVREKARHKWCAAMGDPDYLASRVALAGVDSLLSDMEMGDNDETGISEEGDWAAYAIIIRRDASSLREAAHRRYWTNQTT